MMNTIQQFFSRATQSVAAQPIPSQQVAAAHDVPLSQQLPLRTFSLLPIVLMFIIPWATLDTYKNGSLRNTLVYALLLCAIPFAGYCALGAFGPFTGVLGAVCIIGVTLSILFCVACSVAIVAVALTEYGEFWVVLRGVTFALFPSYIISTVTLVVVNDIYNDALILLSMVGAIMLVISIFHIFRSFAGIKGAKLLLAVLVECFILCIAAAAIWVSFVVACLIMC